MCLSSVCEYRRAASCQVTCVCIAIGGGKSVVVAVRCVITQPCSTPYIIQVASHSPDMTCLTTPSLLPSESMAYKNFGCDCDALACSVLQCHAMQRWWHNMLTDRPFQSLPCSLYGASRSPLTCTFFTRNGAASYDADLSQHDMHDTLPECPLTLTSRSCRTKEACQAGSCAMLLCS